MSERGGASSRAGTEAGDRVRLAVAEAIGRVEARLRVLGRGLSGDDGGLKREAVALLRAGLQDIADALGWDEVLASAGEAIDALQAAHEEVSDEAFATMAQVVAEAVGDLARAPDELARRLIGELDADLAEGASPAELIEQLSAEAAACLIAVGTDFATGLMGLHREGALGEMKAGGLDLFVYDGPDDEVIRPFCADLVDRIVTEADLDELDNGQGLAPTSRYMGGYNCRHVPSPISVEEARALPPERLAGTRARRIVLEGAIGPNEASFQLSHFGEAGRGERIVRRRRARPTQPGPEKPSTTIAPKIEAPKGPPRTTAEMHARFKEAAPEVLGRPATSTRVTEDFDYVARWGPRGMGVAANRDFDGNINLGEATSRALRSALADAGAGRVLSAEESRAVQVLTHEEIHGLGQWKSPSNASFFRGNIAEDWGQFLEEGSTELYALRKFPDVARRMGMTLPDDPSQWGKFRFRSANKMLATHSYQNEVDAVEMLCETIAGKTWRRGNLSPEGEAVLARMAGDWEPWTRAARIADALVAATDPLAPSKRQAIERYIRLQTGRPGHRFALVIDLRHALAKIRGAVSDEELMQLRIVLRIPLPGDFRVAAAP